MGGKPAGRVSENAGLAEGVKILIADDDSASRKLLAGTLQRLGYDVTEAAEGTEAWEVLRGEGAPRLAIIDWMMPGMDGVEICRRLRTLTDRPYIYTLLLSARERTEDVVEGLGAGADDYLSKPFNAHELEARLRAGKRILDLVDLLTSARERLQLQATHDSLTGLLNRGAILERLEQEVDRARREHLHVAVLMGDLDHFKAINDEHGHLIGDTVLRQVSLRLRATVRPYDVVGRYGGEEFLILAPGCDRSDALALAERIRLSIVKEPFEIPQGAIAMTMSLGATAAEITGRVDPDSLLRVADAALYRAKRKGRNCVEVAPAGEVFSEDTQAPAESG
ncbi:MAG TPA: diguanylate cyclase [Terriglobia bacterium]|nr:diguanylate cyclase [Terriglobia bacterium]